MTLNVVTATCKKSSSSGHRSALKHLYVSVRFRKMSWSRVGLEKMLEGLGIGLVSDLKLKVSVSDRNVSFTSLDDNEVQSE